MLAAGAVEEFDTPVRNASWRPDRPAPGGICILSLRQKWLLASLALGVLAIALDLALVLPGLAGLARAFGVSQAVAASALALYALVFAASLPVLAVVGQRRGKRLAYGLGGLLLTGGALFAGTSAGFWELLVGLGAEAIGAAAMLPVAYAEVRASFPAPERATALRVLAAVLAGAALALPPLGGLLVGSLGWRSLFLATAPLALGAALLGAILTSEGTHEVPSPPDLQGALLLLLSGGAVLFGVEALHGGDLPLGVAAVVFGGLVLPNFLLWERSARSPGFTHASGHSLAPTYLLGGLSLAVAAVALFVPLYGVDALGVGPSAGGLLLLPMAAGGVGAAFLGGRACARVGPGPVLTLGFLLMVAGLVLVPLVGGLSGVVCGLLLVGAGVGLTMGSPLQYLGLGLAPRAQSGSTQVVLGSLRALGAAIGPVVYGSLLPSFSHLFDAAAAFGLIGLGAILWLWGSGRSGTRSGLQAP